MLTTRYIIVLLMFLSACATADQIRTQNRENLSRLSLEMSKSEVLNVMGTETVKTAQGTINNPYRTEVLRDTEGNRYEVLFYYTDDKRDEMSVSEDELTPLIFNDARLMGWGWSFLVPQGNTYVIRIQ